jgi:two-component system chemotaxis response regulator CheB
VIGASAGGVEAVPRLLGSLSPEIGAAFFVTLHVSPQSTSLLPTIISRKGRLPAVHPKNGAPIRPGHVYVAPPDYHLVLEPDVIRLVHGPKENGHRPAIDAMFRSAAKSYGDRVAGVLLTGYLDDGVAGLQEIQRNCGLSIVQDPNEATYPEMPRNALLAFQPDHCLPLEQIERLLAHLPNSAFGGRTMKVKKRAAKSSRSRDRIAVEPTAGPLAALACPECHGPLWQIPEGKLTRYQCLVGHRYSLVSLVAAHSEELESALWIALRVLEERITLQRRLAERSRDKGRSHGGQLFQDRIADNLKHAKVLRDILEQIGNTANGLAA